jgi:quercetin dioxygenase-like cupin family protein
MAGGPIVSTMIMRRMCVLIAISAAALRVPAGAAQTPADPEPPHWGVPTTLPLSARVAVVRGDPYAAGETTFLIDMPSGYRIPPHFHPGDVRVGVREGTLMVGMGDKFDRTRSRALVEGDSATIPAAAHHFLVAGERTLMTMTFTGPFTITYLRAEEAPQRRVFPAGY